MPRDKSHDREIDGIGSNDPADLQLTFVHDEYHGQELRAERSAAYNRETSFIRRKPAVSDKEIRSDALLMNT